MKLRRKLALAGIFSLVIITMIISILRAAVVGSGMSNVRDLSRLHMWSTIESFVDK
jgi:hypothetical protein